MFNPDWHAFFVPTTSLLEIILRGTAVYFMLFLMMRFLLNRHGGTLSTADVLLVVLVADASQNAMAADYKSVTEGFALVSTILFWSFFLDWMGARFPAFSRLLHPSPLELICEGRLNLRNMRKELITREELMTQLREQGVEHVEDVKRAYIEGDGQISVIKKDGETTGKRKGPTV